MKKFLAVLFTLAFVFTASVALGQGPDHGAWTNTGYTVGSDYDANGWWFSGGKAKSKAYNPTEISGSGNNVAGALSGQRVKSNAKAFGTWGQEAEAYGTVYQGSGAYVNPNPGTFAGGSQYSGANYYAKDYGLFSAHANGEARTVGGTLAGAARFDTPNTSTSMAGAVTGSAGQARAGCDVYRTNVWGNGGVEHGTLATKGGGSAWTYGTASYSYENDGYHRACGAGLAATGGVSNVTYGPRGVTATARSVSFSTNGPTHTSGGTHISNMPK